MKPDTLASILVRHGLVDAAAVHDPEGYDSGATFSRIKSAAVDLAADGQSDSSLAVPCLVSGFDGDLGNVTLKFEKPLCFSPTIGEVWRVVPFAVAELADKQARTLPSCDACQHWLTDGGACSRRYTTGWCSFYAMRTDAVDECGKFKAKP